MNERDKEKNSSKIPDFFLSNQFHCFMNERYAGEYLNENNVKLNCIVHLRIHRQGRSISGVQRAQHTNS